MSNSSSTADQPKPPRLSAVEIQQEYYEAIGGVDWELYTKDDRQFLLQKIAVALYGPPTKEGDLGTSTKKSHNDDKKKDTNKKDPNPGDDYKLQGYDLRDEEGIKKVFNKICEQAKYSHNGENILITILRVVCVIPKQEVPFYKLTPSDYWVNLHNKNGDHVHTYIFHVFCIRQCISMKQGVNGCRLYIDHDARVYKNWDAYLTENMLPKSVLVVPKNGQYSGSFSEDFDIMDTRLDVMPNVNLSVVPSPALGVGAKVLEVTDTISTVANVSALAGIVGAIAIPAVAPVAMGTALGVGIVTGTYSIVRASVSLADRSAHEQSIGLGNSEARNCWINILVSTFGISCSAAGKLLSWAATTGTNVKILMNAVQFLQYANLGTGIVGVVNSFGDMIYKYHKYSETPSKLEVFQLTTSLLFLGIGAMSNQTAQEIVQDAQATKINEVRESLSSNNKRKMFDKVTAETRRTRGTIQGNAEVIKALKKIDNKDEFFGKLRGMNKQLNKNKLRISLSSDGSPLINNQHNIGVADLQALGKKGRDLLFSKYGPAKVNSKNAPTKLTVSTSSVNNTGRTPQNSLALFIRPEEILKISKLIMDFSRMDQEFIAEFLSELSAKVHDAFLLICAEIIASLVPDEIVQLVSLSLCSQEYDNQARSRQYKIRVILFIFDYFKSKIPVDPHDNDISFLNVLKRYIRDGRVPKETILEIKTILFYRISNNKKIFDDPSLFDVMHDYDTRCSKTYLTLQAGIVLKAGKHDIIIKNSTIEKLEEWFQVFMFSQVQSEMCLNLCIEIISLLTDDKLITLNEINPDDDVIKLTAEFLLFNVDGIINFISEEFLGTGFFTDIAFNLEEQLMKWRSEKVLRDLETCRICRGRRYKE